MRQTQGAKTTAVLLYLAAFATLPGGKGSLAELDVDGGALVVRLRCKPTSAHNQMRAGLDAGYPRRLGDCGICTAHG